MTYLDVANHLDLTEASVKRLFSQEDISLRRLDSICQMLEIDLSHLTRTNDTDTRALVMLTEAQEIEIVSDERQLAVSFLVLNGWTYDELLKYFDFDEPELIQRLAKLDRLKLIELLPKNRIKLRVAPNLTWLKNGPIQRFFVAHFQSPFMENHFDKENEFLRFLSGMYSPLTCSMILKKLNDLAAEIDQLNQHDRNLTFEERVPFGVLLAIRPWHAKFFENLRRQ
jgi:DNA-binding Xre family transcriptional regulator